MRGQWEPDIHFIIEENKDSKIKILHRINLLFCDNLGIGTI